MTFTIYFFIGLHTDGVRLVKQNIKNQKGQTRVVRSVTVQPQPKLVTSAFGEDLKLFVVI